MIPVMIRFRSGMVIDMSTVTTFYPDADDPTKTVIRFETKDSAFVDATCAELWDALQVDGDFVELSPKPTDTPPLASVTPINKNN